MSWELHKKKGEELYSIWSSVVEGYITKFDTKAAIKEKVESEYIEQAKQRAVIFMKEIDEEVKEG